MVRQHDSKERISLPIRDYQENGEMLEVNMAIYVCEIDNSTIVRFSRGNPSASSCRCHGFGISFRGRKD